MLAVRWWPREKVTWFPELNFTYYQVPRKNKCVFKENQRWKSIFVSHMKRNSVSVCANVIKVKPFDWCNTWCSSVFTHIIKVKTVTYYQMSFYLNSQRRDCLSYWAFVLICFPECGMCDVLCNFIWAVAGENQPTKQTWAIYWQLSMHLAWRGIKVFKPEE